jgi:hypothetical protein
MALVPPVLIKNLRVMNKVILEEIKTIPTERLETLISFWISLSEQDGREESFTLYLLNEKQRRMELWN